MVLVDWQYQQRQNKKLLIKKQKSLPLAGLSFALKNILLILEDVRRNQVIFCRTQFLSSRSHLTEDLSEALEVFMNL